MSLRKPNDEDMVALTKEEFFHKMTKTHDYRIESLVKIFKEHAEQANYNRNKDIETFKNNFPHETVPPYLLDNFNVATAFAVMANEIVRLKKALGKEDIP